MEGVEVYVKRDVEFDFDMPAVLADIRVGRIPALESKPTVVDIHFRAGFHEHVDSHDVVLGYVGTLISARSSASLARP